MKSVKTTPYIPAELEIITFECTDILTSSGEDSGHVPGNKYVGDDIVDNGW